jgi:hypothetical protein
VIDDVHAKLQEAKTALHEHIARETSRREESGPSDGAPAAGSATVKSADVEVEYLITKASNEARYTLGPLYVPNKLDAHDEWVLADTLQQSLWEYVRESAEQGRRINLQHGDHGDIQVGEWVECVTWPFEQTVELTKASGEKQEVTLPAGTVYLGVVWDKEAWPLVKKGKLNGYSLGGRAVKVRGASPEAFVKAKHRFAGDAGSKCGICGGAADNGQHYGIDKEE